MLSKTKTIQEVHCSMEAAVPDTFVVVDGVEVTLAEVEALLRRELKSETTRSILCDASHLESGTSLFSKGMCFVKKNTWSSTQLALLLRRLRPGGHIVFKTSPDDVSPRLIYISLRLSVRCRSTDCAGTVSLADLSFPRKKLTRRYRVAWPVSSMLMKRRWV